MKVSEVFKDYETILNQEKEALIRKVLIGMAKEIEYFEGDFLKTKERISEIKRQRDSLINSDVELITVSELKNLKNRYDPSC